MKIRIPVVEKNEVETIQKEKKNEVEASSEQLYWADSQTERSVPPINTNINKSAGPSNVLIDEIRYGFLSSDAMSMFFSMGNNHFFDNSLYLGTQIG